MRFKNSIFALLLVISQIPSWGQIGIGTSNPEGLLDISMTQGFVYPRVPLVNTSTATITTPDGNPPVTGTMVYNTKISGTDATAVYPGLYQWDGTPPVRFKSRSTRPTIREPVIPKGCPIAILPPLILYFALSISKASRQYTH